MPPPTPLLDVFAPILPRLPNTSKTISRKARRHLSALNAQHRMVMHALYRDHRPAQPLLRSTGVFIRYSARQPDDDNLSASFKAVRDQLCAKGGSGIIVDDAPRYFAAEYAWRYAKGRHQGIRVLVFEKVRPKVRAWWED